MNAREMRLGQLAMKGRILTPVSPLEFTQGIWTRFTDIWSGGCAKEPWDYIQIQASPEIACRVFEHVFEHDPRTISCACCGPEYEIAPADNSADPSKTLFIKEEDIVPEWKVPPGLEIPTEVVIKDEDIFKSPYADSKFGIDGTPKFQSVTDYEHLLQQNIKTLATAFQVPEQFLSTMSGPALGKAAADFGEIPMMSQPAKPKLIDQNSVAGSPISFTNPPIKDVLPPGMHYAYDDIAAKQKKKK